MSLQTLIHKAGKGPKGARPLFWEEAREAMAILLDPEADPLAVGAFLLALRVKGETAEELAAFASVVREGLAPVAAPAGLLLDVPTSAGKADTVHLLAGAAFVLAGAGVSVLLHGGAEGQSRFGTAEVLGALGLPRDPSPAEAGALLAATGVAYVDLPRLHPALARGVGLRPRLGVRTLMNTVARLLNPASAKAHLVGISHPPYFEKLSVALGRLGASRVLVLKGLEGEPEVSPAGSTPSLLWTPESARPEDWTPKTWGLPQASVAEIRGGAPEGDARRIEAVLEGRERGAVRTGILLTAAAGLLAAGRVTATPEGLTEAIRVLDAGLALDVLRGARRGLRRSA